MLIKFMLMVVCCIVNVFGVGGVNIRLVGCKFNVGLGLCSWIILVCMIKVFVEIGMFFGLVDDGYCVCYVVKEV